MNNRAKRLFDLLAKAVAALLFVVVSVAVLKAVQGIAVEAWSQDLGFDLATTVAVLPVFAAAFVAEHKCLRPYLKRRANHG